MTTQIMNIAFGCRYFMVVDGSLIPVLSQERK